MNLYFLCHEVEIVPASVTEESRVERESDSAGGGGGVSTQTLPAEVVSVTLDQVDAPGDDDHDESEDLGDGEHLLHLGCQLHIGTINSSQETLIININYY